MRNTLRHKTQKLGLILFGPVEEVHDSLYQQIDGETIREAALRTKGSGGPSGVDASGFKRFNAFKIRRGINGRHTPD